MNMTSRLLITFIILIIHQSSAEDGYLRYVKDGCFIRGEALSCVKYKALKIAKNAVFGDMSSNKTIRANRMISLVPLDQDMIKNLTVIDEDTSEPKSILSEWAEVAKYFMKLVQEFFKMKGLRVNLPEGARTVEEDTVEEDARGKKKKLAIIVPLLTLLAAIKIKFMLIPVLLAVLLIKKLLLIAALLLPSLLNTLKACKDTMAAQPVAATNKMYTLVAQPNGHQHHHPMSHHSYFGSSDASDYSADYGSALAYSSSGGYGKDWASNRAYSMKHRPTAQPAYMTAPGAIA